MPVRRVLLLTNAITPDRIGGLERYVRELAGALARAGVEVELSARQVDSDVPAHRLEADGVAVRRFPTPSKRDPLYALKYPLAAVGASYRAARAQGRHTVIHSHFPLQGVPLATSGTPYIHTFHAPVYRELLPEHKDSYALPVPLRRPAVAGLRKVESLVLRKAEQVVALSEFMAHEATTALGADPGRIALVPGGIDTEVLRPGPPIDDPWAAGAGPLLFAARRLVPRTGVPELVEAVAMIAARIPDVRVAIAGRGPLDAAVRDRVAALDLQRHVRLLGWVSDAELIGWYRAADLVVLPTQELEGFGLATAEALACGTPVVGTPAGATPEVLGRLDRSLITRDRSPGAIAEKVVAMLEDRERLARLAAGARASVEPALSWATVVDRHLEIYERHAVEFR
jgi:glycosyltransferase involved in cell wall biosynthesis